MITRVCMALAATLALTATACDSDSDSAGADTGQASDTVGGDATTADTATTPDATVSDDTAPAADTSAPQCPDPTGARPTARSEHAGIYDPVGHQLVFFGGSFGVPQNCSSIVNHTYEDEVWFYDLTCDQWRASTATPPVGRVRHMAAYDSARHRMLVYGGRERAGQSGSYTLHPEVLAFDLATEAWTELPTTGSPAPRYNAAMVYDPTGDRMIVFGGNTSSVGTFIAESDETWSLDLASNTWTQITPAAGASPSARTWVAGLWDDARQWLVVYGGSNNAQAFSQTAQYFEHVWALDFSQAPPQWYQLDTSVQAPEGRFWPGLVHDTVNDTYLMFGGHDDQGLGNRNDLWSLAPLVGTWEPVRIGDTFNKQPTGFCMFPPDFTLVDPQAPERRHAHMFVSGGGKAWTTGGKTDCGNVDDVYELDMETRVWTERVTATVGEACIRKGGLSCNDMCF